MATPDAGDYCPECSVLVLTGAAEVNPPPAEACEQRLQWHLDRCGSSVVRHETDETGVGRWRFGDFSASLPDADAEVLLTTLPVECGPHTVMGVLMAGQAVWERGYSLGVDSARQAS